MAKEETKKTEAPALATEVEVNEALLNEYVTVTAPRAQGKADQTLLVVVNGRVWNIPRGKPVTVPKYVKDMIEDQQRRSYAYEQAVSETYESASVQYLNAIDLM